MARNVEFDEQLAISRAMDVFWKKGYNGASMRDLTGAMGISASSVYNTIGDKHHLFIRCISNYTETRMVAARKQVATIKSPIKAITGFINASAFTITSEPNSCLAIKTTFEMALGDAQVQRVLKQDSDFTYGLIRELVEKAIELKEIKVSQDAGMLTDYIINQFGGWHESFIIHKDKARIQKMAKFLIEILKQ